MSTGCEVRLLIRFKKVSFRLNPLLGPGSTTPATIVCAHSSFTALAVGFADGSVILYQADNVLRGKVRYLSFAEVRSLESSFIESLASSGDGAAVEWCRDGNHHFAASQWTAEDVRHYDEDLQLV